MKDDTTGAIPAIDLFAGPGGLGEGFSALRHSDGTPVFDIRLSIEKDEHAHQTLQLRSFVRQFRTGTVPSAYYDALRDCERPLAMRLAELYSAFPNEAEAAAEEAWCAELGEVPLSTVRDRVGRALGDFREWVLLGGPPCQAYSVAGRSRRRGIKDYQPTKDVRQFLYVEYLQVIADHVPAVFVMENVKGLLSATLQNRNVFGRIVDDLVDPAIAIRREGRRVRRNRNRALPKYEIHSLVEQSLVPCADLQGSVVPMEHYGIPQARHRIILVGIRADLNPLCPQLRRQEPVHARSVLGDLPRLRSGLSREKDSPDAWRSRIVESRKRRWYNAAAKKAGQETFAELQRATNGSANVPRDRGAEFVATDGVGASYRPDWFSDARLGGVLNHSSRSHMLKDLYRYLYAACYAAAHEASPTLGDFPKDLYPDHANVDLALEGGHFADRFRVQVWGRPATTITSHIAKDGHYYIHPDPEQCRSLTVREAARLQTFPDNYLFCGPRTAQYTQVGNAVPPLLAHQIAEVISRLV